MPLTSDEENDGSATPPKNKKAKSDKHRLQKFRSEWKFDTKSFGVHVALWLDSDPNNKYKAKCKWCSVSITANKPTIEKHAICKKHISEGEKRKSNTMITKFTTGNAEPSLKHKKAVQRAEIKIAGCFAAHNVPMRFMDHLVPVLKSSLPDSTICKDIDMKRLKCTRVVTNVIGNTHKEDLSETLKKIKFSVLTDESTHFNVKTAAVAVRFYDKMAKPKGRIVTKFWDLSDVFPKGDIEAAREGATGDRLYQLLISAFTKKGIPLENFIGFASDGASVMLGVNNSVMTRLKESCPGIVIMRCVCHSLHLAARDASKALPRACEDLARNTYSFFKHSSKRVAQFAEFQQYLEVAEHKMLLLSVTRWLCLRENIDRILEQWEPLRLYLTEARFEDSTHGTEMLYSWLNDPQMKAYYLFLAWVLPKVSQMNAYFQHSKVVVTSLYEKMTSGYKELLQSFMKSTYLTRTPLSEVDPNQRDMYWPLANLYLGGPVAEQLKHPRLTPPQIEDFKLRCRNYLIALCAGIKQRFDFDDPLIQGLPTLKPSKAISYEDRQYTHSILPFADLVPRAKPADPETLQAIDDQWRRLPLDPDIPREIINEQEVDAFWGMLGELTDSDGVLSRGLCLASECVKSEPQCCQSFEPTPKMYDCMTANILYHREKEGHPGAAAGAAGNDGAGRPNAANDFEDEPEEDPWDMVETVFG
ncbi:Zinc finger protein 862 [Frankliniella fusca]|uniref:Zinc finger protein 862 n=1 Tax=Frankliniella fusca TaxID=407009 RepID=A0AAE1GY91_9NEOP|nr:Zinc finger protein 862 [Frankliniella fusca]